MKEKAIADAARKPTRQKDGHIELFGGQLVNRAAMAKIMHCSAHQISKYIRQPDGLPHISQGGRYLFNPQMGLDWLMKKMANPNPTRTKKK